MVEEKLLNKISNLMKRAAEADDEEGQSSIVLAQRLMAKHNISISEVQAFNMKSEINLAYHEFGRIFWWHKQLAVVISKAFRCQAIISGSYYLKFVGLNEDAKIAKEVFEGALEHIKYRKSQMHYATKEEKNSYVQGFILGLNQKLEAQAQQLAAESNALVVLVPAEVTDYVTTNTNGTASSDCPSSFDTMSYLNGLDEGSRAQIQASRIISQKGTYLMIFQELHDSMLSRSTLSDSKLIKDRMQSRSNRSFAGLTITNVFQTSPVDQILRKIRSNDAIKMQNDLWKARISRYQGQSSLDVLRLLQDSEELESAQFFSDDDKTITFVVSLANEV